MLYNSFSFLPSCSRSVLHYTPQIQMGVSVGSELFVLRKLESVLFADIDCYRMLYLGMFSHNWGADFIKVGYLGYVSPYHLAGYLFTNI